MSTGARLTSREGHAIDLNVIAARYANPMAPQQRKLDDALIALRNGQQDQAMEALASLALDLGQFGMGSLELDGDEFDDGECYYDGPIDDAPDAEDD